MNWINRMIKTLHFISYFILLTLQPIYALAGTVKVVSDSTWNVFDNNRNWLGLAQNVCLNETNPSNCPTETKPAPTLYGYASPGWTANLSSLPVNTRWIWAPNITGASFPAASQEFIFETEFYMCEPPLKGTIYIAADDYAEVTVNGITLPNSISRNHSNLHIIDIPASNLYGSSLPILRANTITVKAKNGPNPPDCNSDQYKCNPAGIVIGALFEFQGDQQCRGYKNKSKLFDNGESETLSTCPPGQTGSITHRCACGTWLPNENTCTTPPPPLPPPPPLLKCTSKGISYNVGELEPIPCPVDKQQGEAYRTCLDKDKWSDPDYSRCSRPLAGVGESCGTLKEGPIKDCPVGTSCTTRRLPRGTLITGYFCDPPDFVPNYPPRK